MVTVKDVPTRLTEAALLFKERNAAYGSNYKEFGTVLKAMLPDGISLRSEEEFQRFMLFAHMVTKLTRYAKNLKKGGHQDSLDDITVYAQMAAECDQYYNAPQSKPEEKIVPSVPRQYSEAASAAKIKYDMDVEIARQNAAYVMAQQNSPEDSNKYPYQEPPMNASCEWSTRR